MLTLVCGLTSCEWIHDDVCDYATINVFPAQEKDVFGLYIIDKNNKVVKANQEVNSGDSFKKEFIDIDGYKFFLYSPYTPNPEGMPAEREYVNTHDQFVFFQPLATQSNHTLEVSKGYRRCKNACTSIIFNLTAWQGQPPTPKGMSLQ